MMNCLTLILLVAIMTGAIVVAKKTNHINDTDKSVAQFERAVNKYLKKGNK